MRAYDFVHVPIDQNFGRAGSYRKRSATWSNRKQKRSTAWVPSIFFFDRSVLPGTSTSEAFFSSPPASPPPRAWFFGGCFPRCNLVAIVVGKSWISFCSINNRMDFCPILFRGAHESIVTMSARHVGGCLPKNCTYISLPRVCCCAQVSAILTLLSWPKIHCCILQIWAWVYSLLSVNSYAFAKRNRRFF